MVTASADNWTRGEADLGGDGQRRQAVSIGSVIKNKQRYRPQRRPGGSIRDRTTKFSATWRRPTATGSVSPAARLLFAASARRIWWTGRARRSRSTVRSRRPTAAKRTTLDIIVREVDAACLTHKIILRCELDHWRDLSDICMLRPS